MRNAAQQANTRNTFQLAAQRPVAEEDERALPETLEGTRQPDHVLTLRQRADAEKERPFSGPIELAPSFGLVARLKLLEVDAAVDHRGLTAHLRQLRLQLAGEEARDGDDLVRPLQCARGQGAQARNGADVAHVLTVRRDHERRLRAERPDQPGGNEEVRVDDLGLEATRFLPCLPCKGEETPLAARAPVEHRSLELVPARGELVLELGDEDSEIGIVRPRIHLRDEQDAHLGDED